MRVKSYFSDTVEAAISQAGRELGEEALLVYSRESTPETRYLGRYEVVFALAAADGAPTERSPAAGEAALAADPGAGRIPRGGAGRTPEGGAGRTPEGGTGRTPEGGAGRTPEGAIGHWSVVAQHLEVLREEMAWHRRQLEQLTSGGGRLRLRMTALLPGTPGAAQAAAGWAERLERAEVDAALAEELVDAARRRIDSGREGTSGIPADWDTAMEAELRSRVRSRTARKAAAGKAAPALPEQAVVLIGPPGSGKTTAAIQIAARAVAAGRKVRLIGFEPSRVARAQLLRSYAGILGVPFEVATRSDRLAAAMTAAAGGGELRVIDGPGLGVRDEAGAAELERFRQACPQLETHLVLPASGRTQDLLAAAARLAAFQPQYLLFTRLDEATVWGPLYSVAAITAWPLSYFCEGQAIPDDFRAASAGRVVAALLPPRAPAAAAAARADAARRQEERLRP